MVDAVSRRYEIVCRLAGGGMADLYLARTRGPGGFERLVVIKRLAKKLEGDVSAVQALLDEARIAATLSHANIVQVNDIEIADGQVSIVMEFLHGHDVAHLLRRMARRDEQVPLAQSVAIVLGVCAGLHHAHERVDSDGKSLAIVHRDVSPHNVFITYDGAVKLVDFGIARASVRKGHTEHGFIKGKPGYIAPELIRGRKIDRRADVWGAAVLLYELTTGATPYGSGSGHDDLIRVTKQDAPLPSTRVADYPAELEAIVMRGLARDPAERYQTADELRDALEQFAREHVLDLSPFRMVALMENVFAENLEAWRQSQRLGKSLAEHVAAFKTSGAHQLVDLPGDPTDRLTHTDPITTGDLLLARPITGPTKLLRPQPITGPTSLVEPPELPDPPTTVKRPSTGPAFANEPTPPTTPKDLVEATTTPNERVEVTTTPKERVEPQVIRPTPLAFESLRLPEANVRPVSDRPAPRRWRKPIAVVLAAPLVLFASLLAWGALHSNHSSPPVVAPQAQPRATAVVDEPIAQPITVVPIEPEPAPAEPAASDPSIEISTAVAHAAPPPAKKRPAAKPPVKRRMARTVQPARAVSTDDNRTSKVPQPAEDDLDALLPH